MKMHTIIFAAAALVGMSALTLLSRPRAQHSQPPAPAEAAVKDVAPSNQLPAPRSVASRPAASDAVPLPQVNEIAPFQPTETEAEKLDRMLKENSTPDGTAPPEAMIANLDAHFFDEQVDRAWSSDHVNFVRDTVRPFVGEGVDLRGVECKTTMCKMDVVFDDRETYREYVAKVVRSDACRECIYLYIGDTKDGRPIMNMYMSREGHSLPRIE